MRKLLLSLSVIMSLSAGAEEAGKFGAGFILGEPTAVSLKYFNSAETAFDLQGSITGDDYFLLWADYLFHNPGFGGEKLRELSKLNPYVGIGLIGAFASKSDHDRGHYFDKRDDDFALGVRVPFGIEWFWKRVPLAIGLEATPGVIVAPATQGMIQGGLTLRFYL